MNDLKAGLLNPAPLDELVKFLGAAPAAEMIAKVVPSLDLRQAEITAAAATSAEALRKAAHKLAGLASSYGLAALSDAARAIEVSNEGPGPAQADLAGLGAIIAGSKESIQGYVAGLGGR